MGRAFVTGMSPGRVEAGSKDVSDPRVHGAAGVVGGEIVVE
jgi:hypothetical protein